MKKIKMESLINRISFNLYSKINLKNANSIFANQNLSSNQIKKYSNLKLLKLLRSASENVPYYKNIFSSLGISFNKIDHLNNFARIPILNKEIINNNLDNLINLKVKKNSLIPNSTSGSTGEPLYLFYDKFSAACRRATVVRNHNWVGVKFIDKEVVLWGAPFDLTKNQNIKGYLRNKIKRKLFLSSYELTNVNLTNYIEKINKFRPKLLLSYPGPLCVLSDFIIKNRIKMHSIKSIICSAETLYEWQVNLIQKAFKSKVYNRYGCREFGDIAQECERREGLHINSDRVYLEIVDDNEKAVKNGEDGKILITDLDNYSMPIIRYDIGDIGKFKNKPCSCGMPFPLLDSVSGRTLDIVKTPNGNKLGGTFWTLLLREKGVFKNFQVIQKKIDHIEIHFVATKKFNKNVLNYFEEQIIKKGGDKIQIYFYEVEEIKKTKSGKNRYVISNI